MSTASSSRELPCTHASPAAATFPFRPMSGSPAHGTSDGRLPPDSGGLEGARRAQGGKQQRVPFSCEEEALLCRLYLERGFARRKERGERYNWKELLDAGRHVFKDNRTPADLKDKARNIGLLQDVRKGAHRAQGPPSSGGRTSEVPPPPLQPRAGFPASPWEACVRPAAGHPGPPASLLLPAQLSAVSPAAPEPADAVSLVESSASEAGCFSDATPEWSAHWSSEGSSDEHEDGSNGTPLKIAEL